MFTVLSLVVYYRIFQEEIAILRENVPYVNLYWYNQTYLYSKLYGCGDNDARRVVFLRVHVLYLFNVLRFSYTAQIRPSADSQVQRFGGECAV
jgi:hypothetical protein